MVPCRMFAPLPVCHFLFLKSPDSRLDDATSICGEAVRGDADTNSFRITSLSHTIMYFTKVAEGVYKCPRTASLYNGIMSGFAGESP
jgi:hypothetical protein